VKAKLIVLAMAAALFRSADARPIAQKTQNAAVDTAFAAFWAATSTSQAAGDAEAVVRSGVGFDEAYRRLKQGKTYTAQKTGQVRMSNLTKDGVEHNFVLNIPDNYDPARKYQVRFQLHGGVGGRPDNKPVGSGTVGQLAGAEQIYAIPYAWAREPWWTDDQALNLVEILDAAKRLYNVDENRVVVSGVSDGGTGAYFIAMRHTTPFASFLPLNGYWMILADGDIDDGLIFANNLRNKPLFVVNGGRDPLYPTNVVEPHLEHMKRGGVSVDYHPQPEAGHNTAWWPVVRDSFETFVRDHPRTPLPDELTWETSDTTERNRAHWLVIDALGPQRVDAKLQDLNDFALPPKADFGALSVGAHIVRVMAGSNAESLGLRVADVLVRLNDETVPAGMEVADALADIKAGSHIKLLVSRNNVPVELTGTYQPQTVDSPPRPLFSRSGPTGRVDLKRMGNNTVNATTRGVARFTLLLSPDQFDFSKPVKVIANGRTVFEGRVEKNLRTLLKFAAEDNDRTMLFGAELHITLPPS
jgi:hypothetical protein